MRLRERKPELSLHGGTAGAVTNELVRAMAYRMYRASTACLCVVALMVAASEASAGSGSALRGGVTSMHSISRPAISHPAISHPSISHSSISHASGARSFRNHRRDFVGAVWPAFGDFYYGPSNGEPLVDGAPPASGDMHYTYTYDVPWDWAHRYPPAVTPSDRPYVSSCPAQDVTVPGRDGSERTVSITRCY